MTGRSQHRSPWLFFLLTYVYSWVLWMPAVLDGIGVELPVDVTGYTIVAVLIGAFAPMLAALTLEARRSGWAGVKVFLGRVLDFRFKPVYLVAALAVPLVIHLIAHYMARVVGLDVASTLIPAEVPVAPVVLAIPYFILMLVVGGGQEEFGIL